jgi:hypothetical protein
VENGEACVDQSLWKTEDAAVKTKVSWWKVEMEK